MVDPHSDDADQLPTNVDRLRTRPLIIPAVPFLHTAFHLRRIIGRCHRYDFLVCFWNRLNFFKLFILHLGLITTPHVPYVHMTYVYFPFLMFHTSHDYMAKRSHYCIMIFY